MEIWGGSESGSFSAGDWLCRAHVILRLNGGDAALEIFRQALAAGKETPTVLLEYGSVLASLGRSDEAMEVYRRAVELLPRAVKSRRGLALECINKGRFAEAVEHLQRTVMLNPRYADAWLAIAGFARRQDLPGLAVEILTGLGDVDAGLEGRFLLAETLAMNGDRVGAERLLEGADDSHMNVLERSAYLLALKTVERWAEHDAVLDRWFASGMGEANSLLSYAWRKLQCGDFSQGWPAYRKAIPGRQTSIPAWQGESVDDKRILVYQDQGFGDLIQFFPLVRRLLEMNPRLTFAVSPDMVALMKCQGINASIVSLTAVDWSDRRFDFAVPQMHLPALLNIRLDESRSENGPILAAPNGLLPEWERRMDADARLKVGVVWAGNPKYVNDAFRSTRLRDWGPLSALPDVAWCCLQKDGASNQAFGMPEFQFWNIAADCSDWLRTASIIQKLDLVISVDTGVAHLAAALGVDTWILLPPRVTDFRWQLERDDCPWYPGVRLFRRRMGESWEQVMNRVAAELERLLLGGANP